MLDSLVSVYMNSDKLGSIDGFESKYSDYDYMDTNTRIAAASTELYADRETLNTYERYKTDEDGNYIQKKMVHMKLKSMKILNIITISHI